MECVNKKAFLRGAFCIKHLPFDSSLHSAELLVLHCVYFCELGHTQIIYKNNLVLFFQAHISSENSELSNAALQALGFCVFNSKITSELSGKQMNFSAIAGVRCICIIALSLFL